VLGGGCFCARGIPALDVRYVLFCLFFFYGGREGVAWMGRLGLGMDVRDDLLQSSCSRWMGGWHGLDGLWGMCSMALMYDAAR
jgi:hypothetical protein